MDKSEMLEKTRSYVREVLSDIEPGHDWFHIERVVKIAKLIAKKEGADAFIVEMAAMLHDLDDFKFLSEGEKPEKAKIWLENIELDKKRATRILEITNNVSFKGSGEKETMKSLEGKVVQDADRLDALGAIGIARVFSFAGYKKNSFFDPEIKIQKNMKFEVYKKSKAPAINHFYEKLLLLKDRMNTKTGKRLAEERHKFMEKYLEKFFKEWEGKE